MLSPTRFWLSFTKVSLRNTRRSSRPSLHSAASRQMKAKYENHLFEDSFIIISAIQSVSTFHSTRKGIRRKSTEVWMCASKWLKVQLLLSPVYFSLSSLHRASFPPFLIELTWKPLLYRRVGSFFKLRGSIPTSSTATRAVSYFFSIFFFLSFTSTYETSCGYTFQKLRRENPPSAGFSTINVSGFALCGKVHAPNSWDNVEEQRSYEKIFR